MKQINQIPFTEIPSIPKIVKDFLSGDFPDTAEDVFSIDNFTRKMVEKQKYYPEKNRTVIVSILQEQLSSLTLSNLQNENLQKLSLPNTFTITTGHQLNLFSGPVFFVYKILQTIKTASFLQEKFPYHHFVPVFWMATEDHDFQEINHFYTSSQKYEVYENEGNAVGRLQISDIQFISEFEKEFSQTEYGNQLIQILKKSYQIGYTYAQATRILVQELFSTWGLIPIDGDHRELKKLFLAETQSELLEGKLLKKTQNRVEWIRKQYGKAQANPRSINLFYLTDTRNRIEKQGGKYYILDKKQIFSEDEILKLLAENPERFSPNALMRPAYQETILPNIAYIGGNAEVAYWLELKDYFSSINLPFPILIPRNSFLFLENKTVSKYHQLGLNMTDFFNDFEEIINSKLLKNNDLQSTIEQLEKQLENQFYILKNKAENTDRTFGNLVKAEEKRQLRSLQKMKNRLIRAEKIKQKELKDRLENVFLRVHPKGIWQERMVHFSLFYEIYGQKWIEFCYENIKTDKPLVSIFNI